ncbi:MAG: ComEC/Rec2 family competence protein [Pseudobdellovibrionaceae bacterium]
MKRGVGALVARAKLFLEETDAGLLFLSSPICLGAGIALYFSLPFEPDFLIFALICFLNIIALIFIYIKRLKYFSVVIYLLFMVCLGLTSATYRSHSLATHMLEKDIGFTILSGQIVSLSPQEDGRGAKLIVAPAALEKLEKENWPQKIALSVRNAQGLQVGQTIRAKAALKTPSGPFLPGGFSFRRYNYFQGIGAQGYTFGPPEIISASDEGSLTALVARLRSSMSKKVLDNLPSPQDGITTALLTGQRDGIVEESYGAMREAGLAHMLAISGLHVGLFAGIVFFMLRLILAAFPPLALHWPIKKIAAFAAIFAALIYTVFVGANIPALRALMTTALIFTAVIVDRSPISLRLVALAALMILLVQPEALVSAGFQMSFGAVTALVLFYDRLRPWLSRTISHAGVMKKTWLYLGGVAMTSLVASIATAPFSLYHFQTLPLYGLAANLAAMPILSFWVMPCAVLAYVTLPFGLEALPLRVMGAGVDLIISVATHVSSWPYAVLHVAQMPLIGLFLLIGAVFTLLTARTLSGRLIVPVLCLCAVIFMSYVWAQPKMLLSKNGEYAALRDGNTLYVSNPRAERFTREQWMRALNVSEVAPFPKNGCLQSGQLCCDSSACRIKHGEKTLSWLKTRYALAEECVDTSVEAVFAPFGMPDFLCSAKVLYSRHKLADIGGIAAYAGQNSWEIVPVENSVHERPWSLPQKDLRASQGIHKE